MKKTKESRDKMLIVVLIIVLLFVSFKFGYSSLSAKADEKADENAALEAQLVPLRQTAAMVPTYQKAIDENKAAEAAILAKYGVGYTPESIIMMLIDLETKTNSSISSIGFTDSKLAYSDLKLPTTMGLGIYAYEASVNIVFTTDYAGLKSVIDYINTREERTTFDGLSVAFDSTSGTLSATMTINEFAILGTDKTYTAPELPTDVQYGTDDIFNSLELAKESEATIDTGK